MQALELSTKVADAHAKYDLQKPRLKEFSAIVVTHGVNDVCIRSVTDYSSHAVIELFGQLLRAALHVNLERSNVD